MQGWWNRIFPLAVAIGDSRNNDSWDWGNKLKQAYGEREGLVLDEVAAECTFWNMFLPFSNFKFMDIFSLLQIYSHVSLSKFKT